jgi:hypothetical protein
MEELDNRQKRFGYLKGSTVSGIRLGEELKE